MTIKFDSALITGASRGIGFEVARTLVSQGINVTVVSRRKETLVAAADALRAGAPAGVDVMAVAANLSHDLDVERVAREHREQFGSLDILVNSAGTGVRGEFDEMSPKAIDLQIGVNLRAVIQMYRACLEMLLEAARERGKAHVFNVASISGKVGSPGLAVYSATKHGIVGFTDAMNREFYGRGLRSTALCPGLVDTDLSTYARGYLPQGKMIQTSDISALITAVRSLSDFCLVPELVMLEGAALGQADAQATSSPSV